MSFLLPPQFTPPLFGTSSEVTFSPLDLRPAPVHSVDAATISGLAAGARVMDWTCYGSGVHHYHHTVSGQAPVYGTDAETGRPCVDFEAAGATEHRYLPFTTPWTQSNIYDAIAIVRFRAVAGSDYQNFLYATGGGGGQTNLYLGSNSSNLNKPMTYGAANTAQWGSAYKTGDLIVVRWTVNLTADTTTIRVGRGTPIVGPGGVNLVAGTWQAMSTGQVSVQETLSKVFEFHMFDRVLSAAEYEQIVAYVETKYAALDVLQFGPWGDSLTDGYNLPSYGGYRIRLSELMPASTSSIGRNSSGPASMTSRWKSHEGYQGQGLVYIAARAAEVARTSYGPAIVLVGTAQSILQSRSALAASTVATVLAQIGEGKRVYLCLPPPIDAQSADYPAAETILAGYRTEMTAIAAARPFTTLVDLFSTFPLNGTDDGVHALLASYNVMGAEIYNAIY